MKRCWLMLLLLCGALQAHAHVGSKDVFQQVKAGPYTLYVTVRPPDVIPGVALVEVRASGAVPDSLSITPTPMTGEASKHPPTADAMKRSSADPNFFTGSVWLMATGSWKIAVAAHGAAGDGAAAIPVPAVALTTLRMSKSIGVILTVLGVLLVVGVAAIVAAAARESRLSPGLAPAGTQNRRAWVAGLSTLALVLAAVWLGGKWWNVEAANYAGNVYRPLTLTPTLQGSTLHLALGQDDPESTTRWHRKNTDLLPDHGHLMHLYAIREPGMDAVFHLHPVLAAPGQLSMALPAMPAGRYRLFGDIVHTNGLPETLVATLDVPKGFQGGALAAEDASAAPAPVSAGELGPQYHLPDGYTMVWDKPAVMRAGEPMTFRFHLLDAQLKPAADTVPYLGMAGHATFVRTDFSTFAHTHPEGSAPMQSVDVANGVAAGSSMADMPGMDMSSDRVGPSVEFPYGFPKAGRYRIFVQMKHGGTVETGVFGADVR